MSEIRQEDQYLAIKYLNETEKYPIIKLCNALNVARSTYYKWLRRTPSRRQQINERVVEWIKQHYEETNGILGYRQMTITINREHEVHYNKIDSLRRRIDDVKSEIKLITRQKIKEISRNPEKAELYEETYEEMLDELANQISGLETQIELASDKQNMAIKINRTSKAAIDVFNDIIEKNKLTRSDLEMLIDKIIVYEDRIDIKLKSNIDALLRLDVNKELIENFNYDTGNISTTIIQRTMNQKPKVFCVNVLSKGDALHNTLTQFEAFILAMK